MRFLAAGVLASVLAGCGSTGLNDDFVLVVSSDTAAAVSPAGVAFGLWNDVSTNSHVVEAGDPWTGTLLGGGGSVGASFAGPAVGLDGAMLYAVDEGGGASVLRATSPYGSPLWRVELGARHETPPSIGADGTLYVGSSQGGGALHAFAPSGDPLWVAPLGVVPRGKLAVDRSGTILLHGITDELLSMDLVAVGPDGVERWRAPNDVAVVSVYVDNDDNLVTGTYVGDGTAEEYDLTQYVVRSRDPADGSLRWEANLGGSPTGLHVRPDGAVLVTLAHRLEEDEGAVVALDPATGEERWAHTYGHGYVGPGVIADNGSFYFGCGVQVCEANATTGTAGGTFFTQDYVSSTPPVVHEGLLIANGAGVLYSWELPTVANTEVRGWPKGGADNRMTGLAP